VEVVEGDLSGFHGFCVASVVAVEIVGHFADVGAQCVTDLPVVWFHEV
jgi:hypothetical protein